jgi:hypothetical protein
MPDPMELRRRMEKVVPPYISVETIVSRGRRRIRLKRFGVTGVGAVIVALSWVAIGPLHLRIGPVPASRSANFDHANQSPSSHTGTVVARGTADGKAWRLVVSGRGNQHLCVRVRLAAGATQKCGLLSIEGPIKLAEGTIAPVTGEFVYGIAGEAITRLELRQGSRRYNLPLASGPPTVPGLQLFVRWLPRLSNGSVVAYGDGGSIVGAAHLQLQEDRSAALAATGIEGVHEALAFIRKHGINDAVLPATLPKGIHLAPHDPIAVSKQGSTISATLDLQAGIMRLYFQYGTAVFDGCGADSARAITIMGVPALIENAAGGGQVDTQLIWPATHAHPEGHFGVAGNISPRQAKSLARSMMRVSALRRSGRLLGC